MTCERYRASGTIRPTLKRVHFTTPFGSAWPLDILHFEKLDGAVQCFSICAHLSPARDSACEQSYGCPKSEDARCLGCSNLGWAWPIAIPPIPKMTNFQKNRTQNGSNGPRSSNLFWIGFVFSSFEPSRNVVGQDKPQLPRRANENIAWARNQHKPT